MKKTEKPASPQSTTKEIAAPGGFSLVPKSLGEAMDFAKLIADSDMVPKDFKGKPGNVLIAVQMGAELGIPPLQSLQNIAVVNGRPGVYGDLGKAILLSKGFKIDERDVKETKAKGEAWCKVVRPNGQVTERTYSIEDAKAAGLWGKQGAWTTNTYRQMAWRAFWFAARDGASDVLKGLGGAEELQDIVETTAETAAPVAMPKAMEAPAVNGDAVLLPGEYVYFVNRLTAIGADMDEVVRYAKDTFTISDLAKLTKGQAKKIIGTWTAEPPAGEAAAVEMSK